MKNLIAMFLILVCVLGLNGCSSQKEYSIRIVVPAGHQGELIYAEDVISPRKSRLEIKSIDLSKNAKFVLEPVDRTQVSTYECTDFPKGAPMLIEVKKGAWYKIGVAMENPTDEDIVVVFHVKNLKTKIE